MIGRKDTMNPYDKSFFNESYLAETGQSATEIVRELWSIIQPASIVDVGCGIGVFLEAFSRKGVTDICGIDGDWVEADALRIPKDKFLRQDLALPLHIENRFDLALCLEVAEHLPEEAATTIVRSLVELAPVVLFSAAIPMQGGVAHVNEQWPEYWSSLFAEHGYLPVDCIRRRVWNNEKVLWWYAQNMILFVKQSHIHGNPRLKAEFEKAEGMPLSVVHPRLFLQNRRPKKRSAPAEISLRDVLSAGKRWALQKLNRSNTNCT